MTPTGKAKIVSEEQTALEILDKVADVLMVLANVSEGDYACRLPGDLPEDHPLGALYVGINEMIGALQDQQNRTVAYQRELEDKLSMIERQRAAIRDLSTPVMEVWDGVLCLPIVGVLDTGRSADMTDALLKAVVATKARCVIVDITGIEVMDTRTADHFIRMAKSVEMLGSECVLTGLNPGIAQTLVHMGVEMQSVITYRSLRDALQDYAESTSTPTRTRRLRRSR